MKGILIKFTCESPLLYNRVFVRCNNVSEFDRKLKNQFDTEVNVLRFFGFNEDGVDRGELHIGNSIYEMSLTQVWQEI